MTQPIDPNVNALPPEVVAGLQQHIAPTFAATAEPQPPTQVRHSWRATLRTVLQYVLAVATALPVIIPSIIDATDGTPIKKYVVIVLAQVLVVIGVITKLMAIPAVDRWLTSIGIGAAPAAGKHEA